MNNLEIKNATIVDGLGKEPYIGNIYIKNGKIIALTHNEFLDAEKSIDAKGKIVTPGFIDLHTHSDASFLVDSKADSKVRQGVTLELIGNCGMSTCAPLIGEAKTIFNQRVSMLDSSGDLQADWTDYAGYIRAMKTAGAPLNVAFQVGHGTLRAAVIGLDDRAPSTDELNTMKKLAAESLDAGALGLSTGLFYAPGYYARTDEVIAIAEEVGKRNKLYSTHQRDEGSRTVGLFVSLNEAIEIGRRANCKVQISHVKCAAQKVWGKSEEYLELLENTLKEGIDIAGDQYPYTASSTALTGALFPRWSLAGGREKTLEYMSNEDDRGRLVDEITDTFSKGRGAEGIIIARYVQDESLEGKTLIEIAESLGTNPAEAALRIYQEGEASVVSYGMTDEDVETFASHPLIAVASDGSSLSTTGKLSVGKPHPRSYGTNPRFIQKYVNEKKVVTIQEAIRKMTSMPAERLGLTNRGRLTPGYAADVVIMDLPNVKEKATFADPHQYPEGISHVIVNGEIVVENEKYNGSTPGQMITDFNS
jgi:N-acyl-D-amino-acid deacylase